MFHQQLLLNAILIFTAFGGLTAVEPEVRPADMPPGRPTVAGEAAATFALRPGFRADLVASEPLVVDPVALAFDDRGRVYVVEMRDYSERRPERLGRVRRLEDSDGDGFYDRATVFLDNLPWPTAITCYDGGVFIGATPDLLFARDEDGDGIADVREVVFTGFASNYAPYATNQLNVQTLLNSFAWGLDNRIHGATSMSGGTVQRVDSDFTRRWRAAAGVGGSPAGDGNVSIDLRGRDFSFDARRLELRAEIGGGQYGMSFDATGRKFVCSNSDHLQQVLYNELLGGGLRRDDLPAARVSIAADGPAAEVFRRSPEEPWRVLRTRWRVSGLIPGLIEGGGRSSGYFTSATGVTIYRGDAWGADYAGDAFIADCGSNLVHRKKLRPEGVRFRGERAPDEQRSEFLASTDIWFRPVQFANAPDGCLWVLDMYRETIEHPWSLPPNIKKHLDLNSGNDRGRLWRLAPDGFRYDRSRIPVPGETSGLVSLLEHPNGWHRETAARRLYERRDPAAVPDVRRMLSGSKSVLGRLHALYCLHGLEALTVDDLVLAARDTNPEVRRHAVELCGLRFPAPGELPNAITRLQPDLESDLDPFVRWSLLLHFGNRLSVDFLARIARVSMEADVRFAALAAGRGRTTALWDKLVADEFQFTGGTDLARELARRRSSEDSVAGAQAVLESASSWSNDATAAAVMAGVVEACERSGRPLPRLMDAPRERALRIAASNGKEGAATDALRLLVAAGDSSGRALLDGWLSGTDEPRRIQALSVLGNAHAAGLPDAVFSRWQPWNRDSRRSAVEVLMRRPEWTTALLTRLETVPSDASAIEPMPLNQLRNHPQAAIRERARKLLGQPPVDREAVIRDYLGALNLKGAADRGQVLYRERCATCHRLKGEGQPLGPDLESVVSQGREKLLVNLLDPNREVAPNFAAWTAETRGDETVTGLLVRETTTSIVLRQAGGQEVVIDRSRLSSFRTDGRSLMPEGLEVGLSLQQVADLLSLLSGEAR